MGKGNGMTRGDHRRNAKREQLRGMLPRDGAVIGIDLADEKQALAMIDHDGESVDGRSRSDGCSDRRVMRRPAVPQSAPPSRADRGNARAPCEASPRSVTSPANDRYQRLALVAGQTLRHRRGGRWLGSSRGGAAGVWRYQRTSPEMRLTEPATMTTPKR